LYQAVNHSPENLLAGERQEYQKGNQPEASKELTFKLRYPFYGL